MDMKPFRRFLRQTLDKGAVLALGLGCLFLCRQHYLPNILGPLSYGIISAGAIGFARHIIMDFDSTIGSAEYQKILRMLDERKAEIQENRDMLEELREACARFMAMREILEGWRRDPSLVQDKVTILEELLRTRDGESSLFASRGSTRRNTSDVTVGQVSSPTSPKGTDIGVVNVVDDLGETTPKPLRQEPQGEISETVQKDILEKVIDEVFQEVLEEVSENILDEESEKVLEEISEDIQKEISERVQAELSENMRVESYENGHEEISEKSLEKIMEKVQKEMLEKAQEGMFEKVKEVESQKMKKEVVEHIQYETSQKGQVEISQKVREEASEKIQEEVPAKEHEEVIEKGQKEVSEKAKGEVVEKGQAEISEKEQEFASKELETISPTQLEEESKMGLEERFDNMKDNKVAEKLHLRIEEMDENHVKQQKEKSEIVTVELQQIEQDKQAKLEKEIEEFLTVAEPEKAGKD